MMKRLLLLFFFPLALLQAQPITFTDITSTVTLPPGVKLIKGERNTNPKLRLWYFDVDMNRTDVAIKPYLHPTGKEGITGFVPRLGAIAGINGGYFDVNSSSSYSALIEPGVVKAKNIATVTRPAGIYYCTRSLFSFTDTREFAIDWIYHWGNRTLDIVRYSAPLPNTQTTPAPAPVQAAGQPYYEILAGIGGGPTLVKNGTVNITYDQEVFFGSGVGSTNRDPRTVLGYTADKHVIMMVIDGRQVDSEGLSLPEAADLMVSLGCVEAMNLDGGGSSQMAIGNQLVNLPVGSTYQRPVPTMLAIVNPDSINLLPPNFYLRKIDNADSNIVKTGTWAVSNISGYWGTTPSIYANAGNGESTVKWRMSIPTDAEYDVYAWWVAASNRASNAPYIIKHKFGTDTVRINQSVNGSQWNRIGRFTFSGDLSEGVTLSNQVDTAGKVVNADALRIISFDSVFVAVESPETPLRVQFTLHQNYPNPFNPSTIISFTLPREADISLVVYDVMGREVKVIEKGYKSAGSHQIEFIGENLTSGVYFYRLTAGEFTQTRKMMLVK